MLSSYYFLFIFLPLLLPAHARQFNLKQNQAIQKILSAVLLLLFSISIIPKTFFHDAIAHHKDVAVCLHPQKDAACVHQHGFHCGFDDLVVTAPYLLLPAQTFLRAPQEYATFQTYFSTSFLQHYFFHAENRGPPQA